MTKGSGTKRQEGYHHGDLRAALVTEALAIVERDGPDGVSLRGTARAAGVSQAAPYHHFKDKQALLAAVAARGFRAFTESMLTRANEAKDAQDRLDKFGMGYVEFAVQHPLLFRLIQGPTFQINELDEELSLARNESAASLIDTVSACLPGATDKQIMAACAGAWSIVHGMAMLLNDGRLNGLLDTSDLQTVIRLVTQQLDMTKCLKQ